MKIRKGSIKALSFFTIVTTITFVALTWYTVDQLEKKYEAYVKESLESEWNLLRNTLSLSLYQAKSDGQGRVDLVRELIYSHYGDNNYLAIAKDLDSYRAPNNFIRTALTTVLDNFYFNNIDSNNTDPFIVVGLYIALDDSDNCATFGSTRTLEDEYTMHANPYLAKEAFNRIQLADIESSVAYITERPIFFQFSSHPDGDNLQDKYAKEFNTIIPEDHKNKLAQILTSYDLDGLETYFKSTQSWEKTFRSFEFITPTYLYDKRDLANRLYVDQGRRTGYLRISINIVFNFKTVIDHNPNLKRDLTRYSWAREQKKLEFYKEEMGLYLVIILLVVICYLSMLYTNNLANIETIEKESKLDDVYTTDDNPNLQSSGNK